MGYLLGTKSKAELVGVHPALAGVATRAIQITLQDFGIHDGLRTHAEQVENVKRGVSQTMNSMHIKQPDGWGHAFDAVPYINGRMRWEWKPIYVVASAVHQAAKEQGVEIRWGGVWDRPFEALPGDPAGLEREVQAYVARRLAAGKKAFVDGPHYELRA